VHWLKPPPLRLGDTVRVVAPSGPFGADAFEAGLALIRQRYQPLFEPEIASSWRYLAGQDSRRIAELSSALADSRSRATFCARGGYGAMRLLPSLKLADAHLAPLVGFSDITALHLALQAHRRVSIHGPVLTQLSRQPLHVIERLFRLLESPEPPPPLTGSASFVPGSAEGPLMGGNLALVAGLVGTPFMPDLSGAILLLEDIGERPYRIDRMFTQLRLAGVFQRVRGLVLGDFTGCEEKDTGYSSADVLRSLVEEIGLPCAAGFPIGHGEVNQPVALGTRVRLDASEAHLTFLEGAVQP
jgi:muramoyltetrapeptide carboxypeptidase